MNTFMSSGMRRSALALLIVTVSCDPAFAQEMPNRLDDAQTVADAHPDLWTGSDNKRNLTRMICLVLNREDGGRWGLLSKDERTPPYIPEDILMWRPTGAHVDVISDSGAVPWIVHPAPPPPTWSWVSCGDAPLPDPVVVVPPPLDLSPLTASLARIEAKLDDIDGKWEGRWKSVAKFTGQYIAPAIAAWWAGKKL